MTDGSQLNNELVLRDRKIPTDVHGNVCLNDLWALAKEPPNKRPKDWHRSKRAVALEAALNERITEIFRNSPNDPALSTFYVEGRGRASRTFAHPVLALDYSEYLDPAIGVEIRDVFIRYRSNEITFALEILKEFAAQVDCDAERVKLRQLVKDHNKQSAGVAKGLRSRTTRRTTVPVCTAYMR